MVRGDRHGPVHAKPVRAPEGLLGSNVARLSIKTSTSGAKGADTAGFPLRKYFRFGLKIVPQQRLVPMLCDMHEGLAA